jgi:hypothetical protein
MLSSKRSRSFVPLSFAIVTAAALALIVGCSSDHLPGILGGNAQPAVVADFGNNRILFYQQPFANGMAATTVLGQPDFVSNGSGGTASTLNGPNGVAGDQSGNLWVVDDKNNRVVRYNTPFSNGMAATLVLGQPDLTTVSAPSGTPSPTATSLNGPSDVVVDSSGNVWVSDTANNRVVKYPAPISNGMSATTVLGEPDLTTASCTTSATGVCHPVGVTLDAAGNIWVADPDNDRVLRFPAGSGSGAAADLVLGQPDFVSNGAGTTASTMAGPNAVTVDNSGSVFVADAGNNRVLVFLAPLSNGMAATVVLGQPDLNSGAANQGGAAGAATLSKPSGLQLTDATHLLVGDTNNNRSVIFASPFSTGMNATTVLGESDFTTTTGGITASTQSAPWGAGPSLIALLTLALLVAGWFFYRRRRGVQEGSAA